MNFAIDQRFISLTIIFGSLVLFLWGKWRYDLVAMMSLIVAVLFKVVPIEKAFLGFGHPAVILVAAALVISAGINSTGVMQLMLGKLSLDNKPLKMQLLIICALTALLSGFINNVGAVALMMPYVLTLAHKSKKSPQNYLIPLAYSSLLGGLITLIGTPPNIIVSAYRSKVSGAPFSMFDFTPVGAFLTLGGLIFVVFTFQFWLKVKASKNDDRLEDSQSFLTEFEVTEESTLYQNTVAEFLETSTEITLLGLVSKSGLKLLNSKYYRFNSGDIIVVEGHTDVLEEMVQTCKLKLISDTISEDVAREGESELIEVVMPAHSKMLQRSARQLDMRWRYGVNLFGVARSGQRVKRRLSDVIFQVGDILLLQGSHENIKKMVEFYELIYLSEKSFQHRFSRSVLLPIIIFSTGLILNFFGFIDITISLVGCALLYVMLGYVKPQELYGKIEWPVIVLVGCMIPLGEGLEKSGAVSLIASGLLHFSGESSPYLSLSLLMGVTMVLTNLINNSAAAVVMVPVAIELAQRSELPTDLFLMGVALAASSAFATPIGHQSNAIVMEPGNYKFNDFMKVGIPLSIFLLIIAVPLLFKFWG
jgi:di/tricarboxylate transporter